MASLAGAFLCKPGKDGFCNQVGGQDQQGQHKHLVILVDVLQLLDLGGEDHGAGPGQEDQGADGDHGVDEVIAEGLDEAGRGVGGHHPEDGLGPAVPHEHGGGLPPCVHLGQGVLHHQVGGGEIVDDVTQDHQGEGVLQGGPREDEQEGQAQDHAGDGVGHQGDGVDNLLAPAGQLAPGGDEGRAVGRQGAEQRRGQGHAQGVEVDGLQLIV